MEIGETKGTAADRQRCQEKGKGEPDITIQQFQMKSQA